MAVLAAACAPGGGSDAALAGAAPAWRGEVQKPALPRPDFVLRTTDGRPYDFRRETTARTTMLFFGYTSCPDVCPVHLANGASAGTGDRVEIDLWTANRSKDVFGDDADVYNPHRSVAPGNEPFGLTFGTGVHTCLGRDLDGGLVPKGTVDVATHSLGIVTLLVKALLDAGAVPDPARPPQMATYTARPNWGSYPVVFGGRAT